MGDEAEAVGCEGSQERLHAGPELGLGQGVEGVDGPDHVVVRGLGGELLQRALEVATSHDGRSEGGPSVAEGGGAGIEQVEDDAGPLERSEPGVAAERGGGLPAPAGHVEDAERVPRRPALPEEHVPVPGPDELAVVEGRHPDESGSRRYLRGKPRPLERSRSSRDGRLLPGEPLARALDLVRDGGRVVTAISGAERIGALRGISIRFLPMRSTPGALDAIADLVERGGLTTPIERTLALEQEAAALDAMRYCDRAPGEVVLLS